MRLIPPAAVVLIASICACSSNDEQGSPASDGGAPDAPGVDAAHDGAIAETGAPQGDSGGDDTGTDAGVAWQCPAGPFGNPLPQGVKADLVAGVPPADGFVSGQAVLEGAVWTDGALYMSQFLNGSVPPSRILRWSEAGGVSVYIGDAGSNGLAVDQNGLLVAAIHKDGSIGRFGHSQTATPIASQFDGKRFDSPNDLTVRADGTVYFTDPDWQAPSTHPQAKTRVYRVDPAGAVSVVDDALNEPNGITLSPDAKTLYVSSLGGIFAYAVAADGTVSGKRAFAASLNSDGMGIDCAGNLYATVGTEVVVLGPDGKELGRIAVSGIQALTNIAFGGANHTTLFATSLGDTQTLHRVELAVPGLPY